MLAANAVTVIEASSLLWVALPMVLLWGVLAARGAPVKRPIVAAVRMVLQLVLVGYLLTAIFEAKTPAIVAAVLAIMVAAASWIALGPLPRKTPRDFAAALLAIGGWGGAVLALVTQGVLQVDPWFAPAKVVPLAGMIFANAMNSVSLAADRFVAERGRGVLSEEAARAALATALLPATNSLLAVGLVSLPGMMTGQILSGVDPLIAVRYQIMVMAMVYGSGGLAADSFLRLLPLQPDETIPEALPEKRPPA